MKTALKSVGTLIALSIFFIPQFAKAQYYAPQKESHFEVNFNIGPSFFLGDLGGNKGKGTRFLKDVNFSLTDIMTGASVIWHPDDRIGLRTAIQLGQLSGDDKLIKAHGSDEMYRKQRNLNFKTNLFEAYVAAEVYPTMFLYGQTSEKPKLRPYGVLGIGLFHFNPQGTFMDDDGKAYWVDLKPLHTEGQGFEEFPDRKEYSLTQINIPMGAGIKYFVSERVNLGFEILMRKTFTDYIDDVSTEYIDPNLFDKYLSNHNAFLARRVYDKVDGIVDPGLSRNEPGIQRGNPGQNDSYFSTFLKVGIRLGSLNGGNYNRQASRNLRCPRVPL